MDVLFTNSEGRRYFETRLRGSESSDFGSAVRFHDVRNAEHLRSIPTATSCAERIVLQIGPIHQPQISRLDFESFVAALKPYRYGIVGELGSTTNSKEGSWSPGAQPTVAELMEEGLAYALLLKEGASSSVVVNTARGKGAFCFCKAQLSGLFGDGHPIIAHVLKIGFRNTMGRADPRLVPPKFVAGLVAEGKGANWITIQNIVRGLGGRYEPASATSAEGRRISEVVDAYVGLCKDNGLAIDPSSGETNSVHGATLDEIKRGYFTIIDYSHQAFGVPIDFFIAGTPMAWDPQWVTGKFRQTHSGLSDPEISRAMEQAEAKWNEKCGVGKCSAADVPGSMPTTPAYDVVGVVWAFSAFAGEAGRWFDGGEALLLKPEFRGPSSFHTTLEPYIT